MILTFEEEGGLVSDQVTSKVLRGVDQASNDCPSQVGTLDKIEQRRVATLLFLNLNSTLHHGKLLVSYLFVITSEALNRTQCLLFATFADEPPWRLGGEEHENQERGLQASIRGRK